jgi:cytochrome c-type biogenesis protein CcmH/NrfG
MLARDAEAEDALRRALSIEPEELDLLYALAGFGFKGGNFPQAQDMARRMIAGDPSQPAAQRILETIRKCSGEGQNLP